MWGSAPAADVFSVARAAGLNENVVKKSRKKAGIRTERRGFGKGASWVWTNRCHRFLISGTRTYGTYVGVYARAIGSVRPKA